MLLFSLYAIAVIDVESIPPLNIVPNGTSLLNLIFTASFSICMNCFFMHKECSEEKGEYFIAYLSKMNNLSLILDKTNKKNSNT